MCVHVDPNLLSFTWILQGKERDEHLPDDALGWGFVVRYTQRNCSSPKSLFRVATWWTWSAMSDLICTFFNSLSLSFCVSLSLIKRQAVIKRLQFQLFSSHVILWFDYKCCLPALSCITFCGPRALASSVCVHSLQVQLKVMFSVICHMRPLDLTQLGLIQSPLSAMAGGFSYAVQTISTANWRKFNLGIRGTTGMEMILKL